MKEMLNSDINNKCFFKCGHMKHIVEGKKSECMGQLTRETV